MQTAESSSEIPPSDRAQTAISAVQSALIAEHSDMHREHLLDPKRVEKSSREIARLQLTLCIYPDLVGDGWWFIIGKGGFAHSVHNFATAAEAAKAAADCICEFSDNPAAFVLAHP